MDRSSTTGAQPSIWAIGWLAAASILGIGGCRSLPNPEFPVTARIVHEEWQRMRADPKGLDRPLVVLDGWRQPSCVARSLAGTLRDLAGADKGRVLSVSFFDRDDLDTMADDAIRAVESKWPSDDPTWTTEVDVVGYSMGGIVARTAAMQRDASPAGKRLKIRRLYTISTPHRGAKLARTFPLDQAARDMRPAAPFLRNLDDALPGAGYELICYAHTNDRTVGARNTAPPGREPHWVQGTVLFSHFMSRVDPTIIADIALRLRAETPLSLGESAPPRD